MDRPSLPELAPAEHRALKARLTPLFVDALVPEDLTGMRKKAKFVMTGLRSKAFSLSSERSIAMATGAVLGLGVYGQTTRAVRAAEVITRLPFATHRVPEEIHLVSIVRSAFYFAVRDGSPSASLLEADVARSVAVRPHDNVFNGRLLRPYLDEPFPYGEHRDAYPAWHQAANYLDSIREFIRLWSYGGSELWPVARLEAEIERYIVAIHREPGLEPVRG